MLPAEKMVDKKQGHAKKLNIHPCGGHVVLGVITINNSAENNGQYCRRSHDAPVELSFHYFKTLTRGSVLTHCMIDKQARQIKDGSKPAYYRNYMKSLEPEHY